MDKNRERTILDNVYGRGRVRQVIPGEKPDFECVASDAFTFGAEVTELFISESAARSALLPNYLNEIVHEGRYRHKDDKIKLRVEDAHYTNADTGKAYPCRVIQKEQRTTLEFCNDILRTIESKNAKYATCRLTPVDLILYDGENQFGMYDIETMVQHMLGTALRESIVNSPFREIYLVTNDHQSSDLIRISLRATTFASEIATFRACFNTFYRNRNERVTVGKHLSALGHYLNEIFPSVAFGFTDKRQLRFIWASVACGYNEECALQIEDVAVFNQPRQSVSEEMVTQMDEEFAQFLKEEKNRSTFTMFIQVPVESTQT